MEIDLGIDVATIQRIRVLSNQGIKKLIQSDPGKEFTVTKSLVNIAVNILQGNLDYSRVQRKYLDDNRDLVHQLLDAQVSLEDKQAIFSGHPSLVRHLAASCPYLAGL